MSPAYPHGAEAHATPGDPAKGDVVAFRVPRGGVQLKRVAGVAGDTLGPALPVPSWCTWDTIPEGMFYAQADRGTHGSAVYGLVRLDRLIGIVEPCHN